MSKRYELMKELKKQIDREFMIYEEGLIMDIECLNKVLYHADDCRNKIRIDNRGKV